ncbi:hypothetical protein [Endozoicomonas elysicola]|uniref:Uncharacterized protein n=1 Tax=Endozoicomonas elysicola TaxID=305900 RepID=A0A081KDB4_9GAMM|nr:hypothetical protein [Endozoicomonas elysicola]KEI72140.1 hypothetical protein GV64_16655 [Endozoicomonas elysicola]
MNVGRVFISNFVDEVVASFSGIESIAQRSYQSAFSRAQSLDSVCKMTPDECAKDLTQRNISIFNDRGHLFLNRVAPVIDDACHALDTTVCYETANYLYGKLADKSQEKRQIHFYNDSLGKLLLMFDAVDGADGENRVFKCGLCALREGVAEDKKIGILHEFIVVKCDGLFHLYQSMADYYTLRDFIKEETFFLDGVRPFQKKMDVLRAQIKLGESSRDLAIKAANLNGEGTDLDYIYSYGFWGDRAIEHDALLKALLDEYALRENQELTLRRKNIKSAFQIKKGSSSVQFKERVLFPLFMACQNIDDGCFISLFGVDRASLALERRHEVFLEVASSPIHLQE